jgi:hypothetical protein
LLEKPSEQSMVDLLLPALRLATKARQSASRSVLDSEAPAVLALAKAAVPATPAVHLMFDHFVHDSLAGFNHHNLEPTGYWRYRKGFLGSPKRLIAENDTGSDMDKAASTG